MSDDKTHATLERRTLFDIRRRDPRERNAIAGAGGRRAPQRRGPSSDVTRFRGLAIASVCAAVAVALAWWQFPARATSATGALALPHRQAKLECSACHEEGAPKDDRAADACSDCHGGHTSQREPHRRLMRRGELRCIDCHDVHGDDQGVRFFPDASGAVRYRVGSEERLDDPGLVVSSPVTVPLVPIARCAKCHDPGVPTDPIARCVMPGAEGTAVAVCFDEHQSWSAVAPPRRGGVCSAQHGNDRFAAWEAARAVAAEAVAAPAAPEGTAPLWWLGAGLAGGLLGLFGTALGRRLGRKRVKQAEPTRIAQGQRLPLIDESTCLGCYACVDACPYDVLQVERYVAVVVRPDLCCGLSLCEQVCPNGSLAITDVDAKVPRLRLSDDNESVDTPGVYLAGDVTGVPLIKNAIVQGDRVMAGVAGKLPKHEHTYDVVVVGAGPAGISAALRAKQDGLRCKVIEQGSVAQSIRSFPRGKLVFDQPLELPRVGKLWLEESTKEELLERWIRIVRSEKLDIDEGRRFTGLEPVAGGFAIVSRDDAAETTHRYDTSRVVLAIGLRGSPRRLDVPLEPEVESRVFYHLADARSVAGQRVLVVGLGDVAMETAVALARQPDTRVTVSYRGEGFSRGKARNIAELRKLVDADRVKLVLSSSVVALRPNEAVLRTPTGEQRIDVDATFVMIGSVPPLALLAKAGVHYSEAAD